MESDSLIAMMSTDSIDLNQNDTLQKASEIETTVNYKAKDSIFYDLKNQKIMLYGNSQIDYGEINL